MFVFHYIVLTNTAAVRLYCHIFFLTIFLLTLFTGGKIKVLYNLD